MRSYVLFSTLCLIYVAYMGITDPVGVMNLVNTPLNNNDAISSIRGIYGGVGLLLCGMFIYLFYTDVTKAVFVLLLFWMVYALSRIITIATDGPLGDFGTQWLFIESILAALGSILWLAGRPRGRRPSGVVLS